MVIGVSFNQHSTILKQFKSMVQLTSFINSFDKYLLKVCLSYAVEHLHAIEHFKLTIALLTVNQKEKLKVYNC